MYASGEQPHDVADASLLSLIQEFGMNELQKAIKHMSKFNCAGKHGGVVEMVAEVLHFAAYCLGC